jgi:hypothetical protein
MRRLALLVVLALAVSACDEDGAGDCDGSYADAIVWNGDVYFATRTDPPRRRQGAPVEGGYRTLCGGRTRPVELRRVRGVPAEAALYPDGDTDRMYLDDGFFIELPDHPLHDQFYGGPTRPRRRERGRPCTLDGEVSNVGYLQVRAGGRDVLVVVDVRTRIEGFDRAGLPYLEEGDAVRVRGHCRPEQVLARRIEPRP